MRIKRILILIGILFICSYLDKNNVQIKEDGENQYLSKIVYGAKNIGALINNINYKNLYYKVKTTTTNFTDKNSYDNIDLMVDNISINLDDCTSSPEKFINDGMNILNKGFELLDGGVQILDEAIESLNNIFN